MKGPIPRKSSTPPSSPPIQSGGHGNSHPLGSIVLFENDGQAVLAIVLGERKGKLLLLTMRGREVELPAFRLASFNTQYPQAEGSSKTQQAEWLLTQYTQAAQSPVDIQSLYELVRIEGEAERTAQFLAELAFVPPLSFQQQLAVRLALINDKVYFKRHSENAFSPRPESTVEQLKHADTLRRARSERLDRLSRIFLERLSANKDQKSFNNAELNAEDRDSIQLLLRVGAENPDVTHEERRAVKELMNVIVERGKVEHAPGSDEQRALFLLDFAGLISPDENLSIVRHSITRSPTPEAEREAHQIAAQPVTLTPSRRDLTAVWCCTVDDVTTGDMDDALSIEPLPSGGYRLGIHISDCGAIVPTQTPLDINARERATSLYLAGDTIHMLPEVLSEDYASLRAEQLRYSHSVLVSLDAHLEITGFEICPSVIRSAARFTYDQVDEILLSQTQDIAAKTLRMLRDVAESHERYRFERGATASTKREVIVSRGTDGELKLQIIDERSPSRLLVAELMVLGNRCLAEFARDHKIPVVFRAQDKAEEVVDESLAESADPEQVPVTRRIMKKSFVGFTPQPHAGLGLPVYIQATSPIRRYIDLCHQRQFSSFIATGKPLYTEEQFKEILMRVEPSLAAAQAVSKETKRYWHLVYLKELMKRGEIVTGTVARRDTRTPLVEIDCIATMLFARIKPSSAVGSRVNLRIVAVRPREGFIRLEEV